MPDTAYEAITSRQANVASTIIEKYTAVAVDTTTGQYKTATAATDVFVGICEYPAEQIGTMATVVRGVYPGRANAAIAAGAYVAPGANGNFVSVATGKAVGIALSNATAANTLFAVQILDAPYTI